MRRAYLLHTAAIAGNRRIRMNTYTYTIYDGDPTESGPCEWPSHTNIELRATCPRNALRRAFTTARRIGRACGEYSRGDRLWITVWDEAGIIVRGSDSITL